MRHTRVNLVSCKEKIFLWVGNHSNYQKDYIESSEKSFFTLERPSFSGGQLKINRNGVILPPNPNYTKYIVAEPLHAQIAAQPTKLDR